MSNNNNNQEWSWIALAIYVLLLPVFPVAILFYIVYSFYLKHKDAAWSLFFTLLHTVGVAFIIIMPPIITFLSLVSQGVAWTLENELSMIVITCIELFVILIIIIASIIDSKTKSKNHHGNDVSEEDSNPDIDE